MIDAEAFLRFHDAVASSMQPHHHEGTRRMRPLEGDGAAVRKSVIQGDGVDDCREAALRLLDAAPRSSGALRDRLLGKGYDESVVDRVIERLAAVDLLDDDAYAESAVRWCAGRLMGRRGTVMELMRKGVGRALAEQVTCRAEEAGVFEDAAWELGRKVARRTQGLDRRVRVRRFWSAGGRKGHDPETLGRVAAELF